MPERDQAPEFKELWAQAKRYRIEEFKPFAIVGGKLWAPAYIKGKYRILELDMNVARMGAGQVFALAADAHNIISLVHAAMERGRATGQTKVAS